MEFQTGPFSFTSDERFNLAGKACRRWVMSYGNKQLAMKTLPDALTQSAIIEEFGAERSDFELEVRSENQPGRISLIDCKTDEEIAHFMSFNACGMTPGIIDGRSRYWIRSSDRRLSRNVTLTEFADIAHLNTTCRSMSAAR